nr:glycosyltransferase family 2 protein [uncultured Carboxylicivirga sp.]
MKTLSIITINLNQGDELKNTLMSIIDQSFTDFELIVIDGGSTDHSTQILKDLEAHIDVCISEPDMGIYDAQNKGIGHANSKYTIFMNAGDYFYSKHVLENVFVSNTNSEDILYGDIIRVDNKKEQLAQFPSKYNFFHFFKGGLCPQSIFSKTELHKKYPFDISLRFLADRDFYLKAMQLNCSFKYLNEIICYYDANGVSNNPSYKKQIIKEHRYLNNKYIPELIQNDYNLLLMIPDFMTIYNDIHEYPGLRKIASKLLINVFKVYKFIYNLKHHR